MSQNSLVIVIAVAVVAVLLVVLIAVLMRKRNAEQNRAHAEQLRTQAATQTPVISESERQSHEAEERAKIARSEAERAEQRAAEARQGTTLDQARQEDAVREADRIDPDVDHRSADYAPTTPSMGTPVAEPPADATGTQTYDATAGRGSTPPAPPTTDSTPTTDTPPATETPPATGNHRAEGPTPPA